MTEEAICAFLSWDTTFFGQRIGKVNHEHLTEDTAHQIDAWSADQQIDCLYFLANDDPDTVRIAEDYHYRLHDVRITLETKISPSSLNKLQFAPDFVPGNADMADAQALLPLTQETFTHSRFYHDPNFSKQQCDKLYETWLLRSLDRSFADAVFKIDYQGMPCAYITGSLDQEEKIGSIGIVGVSSTVRGHNLGSHLINAILRYFSEQGMESCEVVTQARNIAAQRLYQKCGFRTSNVQLWYHKWYH